MEGSDRIKPATRDDWKAFGRLVKKSNLPWLVVIIAFVLSIISAKVSVLFPDYSIQFFEAGDITKKTIATGIGLLVLAAVVSIVKSYIEARLRTGISMRIRDRVLEKIFALRVPALDRINSRELISRTSSDTAMLSDFIVTILMVLAGETFHFYFAMKQVHEYSMKLFWFQLLFVPLSLLIHFIQGKFSYRYQYGIQFRLAGLTEYLSELLVNIPVIKIFTKENKEIQNGEERIDEYAKVRTKSAAVDTVFSLVDQCLRLGNRIFAIVFGGYLVHKGEIDIGTWIAYYMIVEQLTMNVELFTSQWAVLKGVQGAISRTAEIMEMEEERYEGDKDIPENAGFTVDNISVRLGENEILKGISTVIEPGSKIAIVGGSGSGKSTFLNTLIRFYDAEKGSLSMGGKDIAGLDLGEYRKRFSYVFQDINLFSGTLRYNMTYGVDREVSDEEILEKCRAAGLSEFLGKQKDGLDSVISEGGGNVSGGEKQRIGIVRGLLRNPEVILLDEATANLDAETEQVVLKGIAEASAGSIVIMVAHRFDIVKNADLIIYLEEGRILAEGTHESLMETCDEYRKLVEAELMVV